MRPTILLVLGVLIAGCGNPGLGSGGTPTCDVTDNIRAVTVMQLQAVPEAVWGPCIDTLPTDWDYVAQVAKQGEARFWLTSPNLGFTFLEVTLAASCRPGDAEPAPHPAEGVERRIDVADASEIARVVIVPVAPRHQQRVQEIATSIRYRVGGGRSVIPEIDAGDDPPSVRIEDALAAGRPVIVIDDREVADGTVELRLPHSEPRVGASLSSALADVIDAQPEAVYLATWYDTFAGGCITYRFTARGDGAVSVGDDVDRALGLFPLSELRAVLIDELGYDIVAG